MNNNDLNTDEIRRQPGPVAEWLRRRHPSWQVVGRVCLHLAENRGDEEHPFGFLKEDLVFILCPPVAASDAFPCAITKPIANSKITNANPMLRIDPPET